MVAAQLVFERCAERARRARRARSESCVDVDDAVQPAQVEHDAAVQRHARAAHAAASCRRGDRDRGRRCRRAARRRPAPATSGAATAAARRRDLAVERPDHRQRPPVAARLAERRGVDGDLRADVAQPGQRGVVDVDRTGVEPRRDVGRVAAERDRRSRPALLDLRQRAARALGASSAVSGQARATRPARASTRRGRPRPGARRSVGVPAELGCDQLGDRRCRGRGRVAGEEAGAGAAGEHVVERAGHLVAHGVDGLGPQVRQPGHERLAERGVVVDEREHRGRLGAVAAGEVLVQAGLVAGGAALRSRRRRAAGAAWSGTACARSRGAARPGRRCRRPCAGTS